MQLHRLAGPVAGFLCLAVAAPAVAAPSNVTVRVEGNTGTVLEETSVRTVTGSFDKGRSNPDDPGEGCSNTSAGGALDIATRGDWDGPWSKDFGSYSVERILGEAHPFTGPDYYSFWVNNRSATAGLCKVELQDGDDVLFFVDRCDDPQPPEYLCKYDPITPLGLQAPATATAGAPVTVTVVAYDAQGRATPQKDARVTGSGVDAVTNGDGRTTVTFAQPGTFQLKASAPDHARTRSETVNVSAPGQPAGGAGEAELDRAQAGRVGRDRPA